MCLTHTTVRDKLLISKRGIPVSTTTNQKIMNDWIQQDRARLRDIEATLAEAEFLDLSDEEVATLENEANEIEGALSDFNEWSRPMDESILS